MADKKKVEIAPYMGWRPRSMRFGNSRHEGERGAKRERLGNAQDRALYKSAHAPRTNPARYAQLCSIADGLNGRK